MCNWNSEVIRAKKKWFEYHLHLRISYLTFLYLIYFANCIYVLFTHQICSVNIKISQISYYIIYATRSTIRNVCRRAASVLRLNRLRTRSREWACGERAPMFAKHFLWWGGDALEIFSMIPLCCRSNAVIQSFKWVCVCVCVFWVFKNTREFLVNTFGATRYIKLTKIIRTGIEV